MTIHQLALMSVGKEGARAVCRITRRLPCSAGGSTGVRLAEGGWAQQASINPFAATFRVAAGAGMRTAATSNSSIRVHYHQLTGQILPGMLSGPAGVGIVVQRFLTGASGAAAVFIPRPWHTVAKVLAGTFAVAGLAQALPSNTAYAYSVNIAHSPHTEFHSACIAKATDAKHISAFGQVAAALYRWVLASLAAALATAASLRHAAHSIYNEVLVLTRGIFLLLLFTPAVCMAPLPGLLGMALAAPAAALRAYAERAGVSQPAAAAAAAGVPAQAAALTASCVAVAAAPCSSAAQREADTAGPGPSSLAQQRQRDMPQASVGSKRRLPQAALTLAVIFESAPGAGRESWLRLVKWTLERAGPAFIKWGQWASTRPDLFAKDLCDTLEQLQTAAPSHPGAFSRAAVESALGEPVEILFATFEDVPIASGSIAQIHRATLSALGAARTGCPEGSVVAVKVRHPGVSNLMHRDFILMVRAAALCAKLPGLSELRLEESIRQFGGPLKEQLDLSVEAQHLTRFNTNFASWGNVTFPQPLYPLVAPSVLVESFEEGQLISRYVRTPGRLNVSLARGGVTLFLKMMLGDNFIHADLHPGNILVREVPGPAWMQPEGRVGQAIWHMARSVLWVLPTRVRAWLPADVIMSFEPRIVLLDSGMIVSLSPDDQRALKKFFSALTRLDGEGLGRAILALSENASSYSAYTSQPSAKPLRPSAGAAAAATAKAAAAQASHIPTSATEAMSGSHSTMRSSTAVPEVSTATGALRSVVSSHRSGSGTAANAIGSDATSSSSSRAGVGSSSTAASEAPESGVLVQLGSCKDPEGFIEAMKDLFADVDTESLRLHTQDVFRDLLERVRQHQVTLRSAVSTVVVTTLVLEGWSSKLDPDIRILDMMRDMLAADWTDRISIAVDRIMSTGTLAVA